MYSALNIVEALTRLGMVVCVAMLCADWLDGWLRR